MGAQPNTDPHYYGEGDPRYGCFRIWYGIYLVEDSDDWLFTANGSIALGDLNSDGRLDAFVSNWGAPLIDQQNGIPPIVPWVWINTPDENGYPKSESFILNSLGDLDADGDLDALVSGKAQATVWKNDGKASFSDSKQRLKYTERHGLAVDNFLMFFSAGYDEQFLWLNGSGKRLQVSK